jgi:helicase
MFKGVFIGVDRYVSPQVNQLSCACRDARALHAMFSDTLGGGATLLLDGDATKASIVAALSELANCGSDDVVVVAFSGHGTPGHELVPVDVDPDDGSTLIGPDDLLSYFSAIPARNVLLLLDCCFSGGVGAKVLWTDLRARVSAAGMAVADRISGQGRVVVTASGVGEEAYESQKLGHGLFTNHVMKGLRGAPEVRDGNRVSLVRLLDFVTRQVSDEARGLGRNQHPTMRGTLDGEVMWPIFSPGPLFAAAFPERVRSKATAAIGSLAEFGFPPELLAAWAGEIPGLNALQLSAINDFGLLDGQHLVASAPTSSGKTMLGELAALQGALSRRRALFLLPLKALVYDKKRHFDRLYAAYGIRTIEATGETADIGPLLRGRYDIALLTYEKFSAIAVTHPHVLDQVGTVVVDEVQMIADEGRGANLEFLLTLLLMRRKRGSEPQVIALSAVIGETNGLERWLGGRLLKTVERPVPLDEGLMLGDGRFRHIDGMTGEEVVTEPVIRRLGMKPSSQDWVIPLVGRLVGEGKRVIVFREETGQTVGCANYLAGSLRLPAATAELSELPGDDLTQSSIALRATLQGGVAFHNSHLSPEERRVVEEGFRRKDGSLRVIVATTTLAMGVNTPAEAVVVVGLEHPGQKPYSVAEYKNLAGRAGRLGYAARGTSYLLAVTPREEDDMWRRYVSASPENLASRFAQADARTMIVRVLASARLRRGGQESLAMTEQDVLDFLECSFAAFQAVREGGRGGQWDRGALAAGLRSLADNGLVEADAKGNYHLTPLGVLSGESGNEVTSVIRVVARLRPLAPETITDPAILAVAQATVEADQVLMRVNSKSILRHHQEPRAWFGALQQNGVPSGVLDSLWREIAGQDQPVRRAKRAVACLLWVAGVSLSEIEVSLSRYGGGNGGISGHIRQAVARTTDVLPLVGKIAALLHPEVDFEGRVDRLLIRMEVGVPSGQVELARHALALLTRAEYQRLAGAGLSSIDALLAADDAAVLAAAAGRAGALAAVKRACRDAVAARERAALASVPTLPPYVG